MAFIKNLANKKSKVKKFCFELETWKQPVVIYAGCTLEDATKEFNKVFRCKCALTPDRDPQAAFRADGNKMFVWFGTLRPVVTTIAHEAVHIAMYVLEDRGVFVDQIHDEALAYTIEDIIGQVLAGLKRKK